jgi:branched-chain amino acid transport system permease protein
VLFVLFLFARRLIHSPFGLSLRGIRENFVRMPAIGAPSRAHIRTIYTIAAAHRRGRRRAAGADHRNGVARFARLRALRRSRGHAGARRHRRLYGGLVGAIIYMIARDQFSGIVPQYWYFWIGILLVAVVMFLPNGILGGLAKLLALEPS